MYIYVYFAYINKFAEGFARRWRKKDRNEAANIFLISYVCEYSKYNYFIFIKNKKASRHEKKKVGKQKMQKREFIKRKMKRRLL